MNRMEFMAELERLLADMPEEERQAAVQYYADYFADAGEANEADVIRELGSPEKVAESIKADYYGTQFNEADYECKDYMEKYGQRSADGNIGGQAGPEQIRTGQIGERRRKCGRRCRQKQTVDQQYAEDHPDHRDRGRLWPGDAGDRPCSFRYRSGCGMFLCSSCDHGGIDHDRGRLYGHCRLVAVAAVRRRRLCSRDRPPPVCTRNDRYSRDGEALYHSVSGNAQGICKPVQKTVLRKGGVRDEIRMESVLDRMRGHGGSGYCDDGGRCRAGRA